MEKVLNRFGAFLDIRTGKQEFVEKKKKKKKSRYGMRDRLQKIKVWLSLAKPLFSGGDTDTRLLTHFLRSSRDSLIFFLLHMPT